jgi:cytochrome b561
MNEKTTYNLPLRGLHLLMTAIIFIAIGLGLWAIYLPREAALRGELLVYHKSFGLTALALVALRLLFRLGGGTPPYGPRIGRFGVFVAKVAHVLLYAAMIVVPISGYVHSMAGRHAFAWFGLYPVPNLIPASEALDKSAGQAHYVLALTLGGLVSLHLLAALWHKLRGDGVYERMM